MKYTFILLLSLLLGSASTAQVVNYSLEYLGITPPCNPFEDEPYNFYDSWKVSHGSPAAGDIYQDGFYDGAVFKASYETSAKSEGLFIDFTFSSTHSYDILVTMAHYSGSQLGVAIYATNGLTKKSNSECKEDAIPSISQKDQIFYQPYVYDGPEGNLETVEISDFRPDANYSQFWLHSFQEYYGESGLLS
ncbi:hypothetical protein C900_05859 [Fulvivirga imtechensis AK7]|uniref:Uncharacterized protein n=1 Tax=Fulvivirga imtechensis AK7 TaxID=1237149 RepID=L8JKN4_9BACT|nr:hypothetical protein [Fulvivirga imtechensis]ELR68763.1 hypothetical protein C900_05859 [Fulvivirga imtechensis AK7]